MLAQFDQPQGLLLEDRASLGDPAVDTDAGESSLVRISSIPAR